MNLPDQSNDFIRNRHRAITIRHRIFETAPDRAESDPRRRKKRFSTAFFCRYHLGDDCLAMPAGRGIIRLQNAQIMRSNQSSLRYFVGLSFSSVNVSSFPEIATFVTVGPANAPIPPNSIFIRSSSTNEYLPPKLIPPALAVTVPSLKNSKFERICT